jgi:1-acyl-sn-glycerol-3-phosphate acyltransferase
MSTDTATPKQPAVRLPPRSDRLFRWFRWYARRYCRRHMHAVRLARRAPPPTLHGPAVFVSNHPSWWDPLTAFILTGLFENRVDWGVIDAAALKQYRFLGRAGLFGVEPDSVRGAATFLRTALAILEDDRASLWVMAQGRFADVRERPMVLRPGVGHLASRLSRGVIVPVAIEVLFWDQRTPEALAAFGQPLNVAENPGRSPEDWTAAIGERLEAAQDDLAANAMSRDPRRFETLIGGRAGVGGVYDLWRRLAAWTRGERFRPEHH